MTSAEGTPGGFAAGPRDGNGAPARGPVYLAVQLLPGMAPGDLADVQLALADAARRVTAAGRPVRYLHGMYMPAQNRLLCAFTADDDEAVRVAAQLTRLPFTQVDPDRPPS